MGKETRTTLTRDDRRKKREAQAMLALEPTPIIEKKRKGHRAGCAPYRTRARKRNGRGGKGNFQWAPRLSDRGSGRYGNMVKGKPFKNQRISGWDKKKLLRK